MNSVWSFGDSMTAPIGGDGPYTKWLGREGNTHCEFIAEHFGFTPINKGVSGSSPNQIFDDFMANHTDIKSGDIVTFGWSPIMRYRIARKKDHGMVWQQFWATSFKGGVEKACVDGTSITQEVAEHIILNRYEFRHFYSKEVNRWISFIKEWAKLKGVRVVNWSWCDTNFGGEHSINVDIPVHMRTDMFMETNNIVKDGHYGEVGHKELAKEIIEFLNKKL